MAEKYIVKNDIDVQKRQNLENIRKFQEATLKLDEFSRRLISFQKKAEFVSDKFYRMLKAIPVSDFSTDKSGSNLDPRNLDSAINDSDGIVSFDRMKKMVKGYQLSGTGASLMGVTGNDKLQDFDKATLEMAQNIRNVSAEFERTSQVIATASQNLVQSRLNMDVAGYSDQTGFGNDMNGLLSGGIAAVVKNRVLLKYYDRLEPSVVTDKRVLNVGNNTTKVSGSFKSVGGTIGGVVGGHFGSKMGESTGGDSGSIIGGVAGTLLGELAAPGLVTLFSNPVGWGILAATAIGGAAYYLKKYHDNIDECTSANDNFLSSTQAINGINLTDYASMADKYLSIVYNKQLDANLAIGEHIHLMREQFDLMSRTEQSLDGATPYKESKKQTFEKINAAFDSGATFNEKYAAATSHILNPDKTIDWGMAVTKQENLDRFGKGFQTLTFNGVNFGDAGNEGIYSQIAASRDLYSLGRDTREGSQAQSIISNFNQRILRSQSPEDFRAVIQGLNSYMKDMTYTKGSEKWDLRTIGNNTLAQNQKGYHYVTALQKVLYDQFNWTSPTTAQGSMLSTWNEMLQLHSNKQAIPNETLSKFLMQNGNDIFNESRYGKFGSDMFMEKFGFYDNKWNAGTYSYFNEESGKMQKYTVTANEARELFLSFHQRMIETVNQLTPEMQSYFDSFVSAPAWTLGQKNDWNDTVKDNNLQFMDGKWHRKVFNGASKDGFSWTPVKDPAFNPLNPAKNGGAHLGVDQSKYRTQYNADAVVPKQVIVKIENLMNVKSIDLTNPDNMAIIEGIKCQLSQALIDVVHDFDDTFHG